MNFQQAELGTVGVQIADGFFNRFGARTHDDDNLFGIGGTDIIDNIIFAAGDFSEFIHFFLNNAFDFFVEGVGSFAALEENVGVLSGAADNRSFGTQSVFSVESIVDAFEHGFQIIIGKQFDFFDFVRSAETVKEMHERNAAAQSCGLGNGSHIVSFLNRVGGQHGKTGLTAAHNVSMVAENRQGMISQRTGGNMHDERREFAGDFVHVGNHQEQTLRSGKGGGQSTGLD